MSNVSPLGITSLTNPINSRLNPYTNPVPRNPSTGQKIISQKKFKAPLRQMTSLNFNEKNLSQLVERKTQSLTANREVLKSVYHQNTKDPQNENKLNNIYSQNTLEKMDQHRSQSKLQMQSMMRQSSVNLKRVSSLQSRGGSSTDSNAYRII